MNVCYVENTARRPLTLIHDVMKGLHHLYKLEIMQVQSGELNLDAGRFANFVRDELPYKVVLRFDGNGGQISRRFAELVEWIAGQGVKWSFEPQPESVGRMAIAFTFESVTAAVTFKLVWF